MARLSLKSKIRNLARGGENYRHLRWRVFQAIIERSNEKLPGINSFLGQTFFSLQSRISPGRTEQITPLDAVPFLTRDWQILERLQSDRSKTLAQIYLRLATDYITSNVTAIKRLAQVEGSIAPAVLAIDGKRLNEIFDAIDKRDRQAIFVFRLYGAMNTHARQTIADYFANKRHADWVKQRLLYPLIYHALNLPSERDFAHVISQVLPGGPQAEAERAVVAFLLRGGFDKRYSLPFKCYVGLVCHPFDTLDIVISHYEELVAAQICPDPDDLKMLREILAATGSERLRTIIRQVDGPAYTYDSAPKQLPICSRLNLNAEASDFFQAYVSLADTPELHSPELGLIGSLSRLRFSRYPTLKDFTDVVGNAQQFAFCEVGRFLDVLLTSIYMVERSGSKYELQNLQRQLEYFGCVSPFTLCSPRGAVANNQGIFGQRDVIDKFIDRDLAQLPQFPNSRWWLKRFHWGLRDYERALNVSAWLREVRQSVPLSGNSRFLSGIDWQWLQEVIDALRIKVFAGSVNGIYVLLMRAIETRQREPNILKLALGPLVPGESGLGRFIASLSVEYKQDTLAFIRYFLTPPMIMKMKLEGNYTAALSERLNAMDQIVAQYGLNEDILTVSQYELESRALTNALTFMAVGAAQFEVSWDAYLADAEATAEDSYVAFQAFNKTYNALPVLTDANRTTAHIFTNTQVQQYEFRNRDWPLVNTIAEIIDVFLSSPSYGIEAILAIRIRHDTLRRELATVFAEHRKLSISFVPTSEKGRCLDAIEAKVTAVLQEWIDTYMHTPRGAPTGLFNFVPDQAEMNQLVEAASEAGGLLEIVVITISFIRVKLDSSLDEARKKFRELKQDILEAIESTRDELIQTGQVGISSAHAVAAVIENALSLRCEELLGWFQFPAEGRQKGLTYEEICRAVEGKFGAEILSGELTVRLVAANYSSFLLGPPHIRPAFDLWSEIIVNALKYGPVGNARVRVSEFSKSGIWGLRFSSNCDDGSVYSESFTATPSMAAEPMLKSGKSGHLKIAALAAVLAGVETTIHIESRKKAFHVLIPLGSPF